MRGINLSKIRDVIHDIFQEFKPKSRKNILEFAKDYGILSSENSAITGQFVPFPYQEEILKTIGDDDVELVVWLKSTRVGYTKCINFAIAHGIAEEPCPQMIMLPTDSKASEWSKTEFKPLLRDMPIVGDRIIKTREDNNLNDKSYIGGFIKIRGGTTANNYASVTLKRAFVDEYSRFPRDVGKEGNPYLILKKRIESYWNGQIIAGSTPTIKGADLTEELFEETDKRYRYVPCPHCGYFQTIEFHNLVIPQEYREGVKFWDTKNTKLKCLNCGDMIDHKEKKKMDFLGQWRQTQALFVAVSGRTQKKLEVGMKMGKLHVSIAEQQQSITVMGA